MKAILKVTSITDKKNGYGMPIIEVSSSSKIKVNNIGYNEFQAETEIDESDLLQLRQVFQPQNIERVMLTITCPDRTTYCHYRTRELYFAGDKRGLTNIIW